MGRGGAIVALRRRRVGRWRRRGREAGFTLRRTRAPKERGHRRRPPPRLPGQLQHRRRPAERVDVHNDVVLGRAARLHHLKAVPRANRLRLRRRLCLHRRAVCEQRKHRVLVAVGLPQEAVLGVLSQRVLAAARRLSHRRRTAERARLDRLLLALQSIAQLGQADAPLAHEDGGARERAAFNPPRLAQPRLVRSHRQDPIDGAFVPRPDSLSLDDERLVAEEPDEFARVLAGEAREALDDGLERGGEIHDAPVDDGGDEEADRVAAAEAQRRVQRRLALGVVEQADLGLVVALEQQPQNLHVGVDLRHVLEEGAASPGVPGKRGTYKHTQRVGRC
eukprot:5217767-Pleurochrysis_carterae.AAC.1